MTRYFMANDTKLAPENQGNPLFTIADCGFIYRGELEPKGNMRLIDEIGSDKDVVISLECLLTHYIEMSEDFYRFLFVCESNLNDDRMPMIADEIKRYLLHQPIPFKNQSYTLLKQNNQDE